ncbi:MAG: hypothetical protein Q7W51_05845 [Coriobacteriia bacterium]|nr:hypothetical protein [Coriobacteriia bacterium]
MSALGIRHWTARRGLPVLSVVLAVLLGIAVVVGPEQTVVSTLILVFAVAAVVWPDRAFVALAAMTILQSTVARLVGQASVLGVQVMRADDYLLVWLAFGCVLHVALERRELKLPLWRPAALVAAAGLASGLLAGVPLALLVPGAYLALKFWVLIVIGVNSVRQETASLAGWAIGITSIVALAVGALEFAGPTIVRSLLPGFSSGMYRLGLPAVQSLFPHPGVYGWFMAFSSLAALALWMRGGRSRYLVGSLACAAGAVLSLRLKPLLGLLFAALLGLLLLAPPRRRALQLSLGVAVLMLALGSVASSVVGVQIQTYTGADAGGNARNALYRGSLEIARDNFPVGVGFGRFGSYLSVVDYSPVYEAYGLSTVWGLSRSYSAFAMDTTWPSILGEGGWIAVVGFMWLLGVAFTIVLTAARNVQLKAEVRVVATVGVLVLLEALAESVGAPVFTQQPMAILLAFPVSYVLASEQWQ